MRPRATAAAVRYLNATNKEDDVAIIASHCPLDPDDAGGPPADADLRLALPDTLARFSGIIGFEGDTDVFSFEAKKDARVAIIFAITGAYYSSDMAQQNSKGEPRSNLDAEVAVMDAAGAVLKSWGNSDGLLSGLLKTDGLPRTASACNPRERLQPLPAF